MFFLYILFIALINAAEFDICKNPQIINGSTNIYIEDLNERTTLDGKKGVWVQITAEKETVGYTFHTLGHGDVSIAETTDCSSLSEVSQLPYEFVVETGKTRIFFVSVPETTTEEITVIADKMLVSENEMNATIVRGEFIPLTFPVHTYTTDNTVYYQLIGRVNWKVEVSVDGKLEQTIDLKQDSTELVTIKAEAGIHSVQFSYAKTNAEYQKIEVVETVPSVINAVFRPEAILENSICFEGKKVVVGYTAINTGKVAINTKANGLSNQKYIQIGDTCSLVEEGVEYTVNGEYKIILASDVIPSEESSSIFTITFVADNTPIEPSEQSSEHSSSSQPQPIEPSEESSEKPIEPSEGSSSHSSSVGPSSGNSSDSESNDGINDKTLIAIICVSVIVGILLILAIVLLAFIIYRKCTSKNDYESLN
ncbi:hypothetical protein EHI8A_015290 [Entamoeba histolytica HM-1:IMSS-B]|uniref:Uncharacterized protein n=5 Tax=Entamoeba histolytica TaxID=5759 RepID=C4LYV8_ENTH1|nr:hypothetical protein EHI_010710 [Entamoeba histolytica HM-1:IMSS]EAL47684.1 hypothetical protein EHI_010710 [Entamoeba histolytica HM-1:IMSS]EMD48665.1 Hypothetical protein EHI5A_022400 [Entamoeba histolytica KU27]EMH77833.1 hypothetical protein EHI8A_015290 [Entamoeba histolytica HM-1:IMSS-B]GAT94025.1 hypothetical protein CL6EHI_010710 [Entamoeba histolytica]|eukprot:XP_653059.1 hypothetical protein EHI_010710 [Entamoeba histolytica HM-1:IMSS]